MNKNVSLILAMLTVATALVFAGCDPLLRVTSLPITTSLFRAASGQMSAEVTNPNAAAVRVRVVLEPAVVGAIYTVGGAVVSDVATAGFALVGKATQQLVIGGLTDGQSYAVSLTTVSSSGVVRDGVVRRSVALPAAAFGAVQQTGTITRASGRITVPITNPNVAAVRVRVVLEPAVVGAIYTVGGLAVSDVAVAGFVLAGKATQALVVGGLSDGQVYALSLITVSSSGVAHGVVVRRSVGLVPFNAVQTGTITHASGQITVPITNPNAAAVRVRVTIEPAVSSASYAVGGLAVSDVAGAGFALAGVATQPLVIGGLTNGQTYAVSLITVSSSDMVHGDVVRHSVALPTSGAVQIGTITYASGRVTVPITNPNTTAVRVRIALTPAAPSATYTIGGVAVTTSSGPSVSTASFGLASSTTQPFVISGLTNGQTYATSFTTTTNSGVPRGSIVRRSVSFPPADVVRIGTIVRASGQITVPITNPNAAAVRVRVTIEPAVVAATYTVGGSAVSDVATNGFALAGSATQSLVIGGLTDGETYAVSLITASSGGTVHDDIVRRSVVLPAFDAVQTGTITRASGQITVPVTNPNAVAVRVRVVIEPAVAAASYAVGGSAVSDVAGAGFALAGAATQPLVIGGLANGQTYTVSLTTVSSSGVVHDGVVRRSVALPVLAVTTGAFVPLVNQISVNVTNSDAAMVRVRVTLSPAVATAVYTVNGTAIPDMVDIATDGFVLAGNATQALVISSLPHSGGTYIVRLTTVGINGVAHIDAVQQSVSVPRLEPVTLGDIVKENGRLTFPLTNPNPTSVLLEINFSTDDDLDDIVIYTLNGTEIARQEEALRLFTIRLPASGTAQPLVMSGLTNGTEYDLTTYTYGNSTGISTGREYINNINDNVPTFSPVTIGTVTLGSGQITLPVTNPNRDEEIRVRVSVSSSAAVSPTYTLGGTAVTSIGTTGFALATGAAAQPLVIGNLTDDSTYTIDFTTLDGEGAVYNTIQQRINLSEPESFTITATPEVASGSGSPAVVRLSWTNPSSSAISSFTVTPTPPGSIRLNTAGGAMNSVTIGGSALTIGSAQTFTVVATNSVGSSTATTTFTPVLPPVIWAASNAQDGNMACDGSDADSKACSSMRTDLQDGFDYCQRMLKHHDGTVHQTLRDKGYSSAAFFGSTDTYNFPDIAGNIVGKPGPLGDVSTRKMVSATGNTFTAPESETTLGDITSGHSSSGILSGSFVHNFIRPLLTSSSANFWGFTNGNVYNSNNCSDAEDNSSSSTAMPVSYSDGARIFFWDSITRNCSNQYAVLCIAK